jgi:hypothetical protein
MFFKTQKNINFIILSTLLQSLIKPTSFGFFFIIIEKHHFTFLSILKARV